jgi:hypothetical protein
MSKDQLVENKLKVTVGNNVVVIETITDDEKQQYENDMKEHGDEVAKTNLMVTLCKRIINAKKFRITYF